MNKPSADNRTKRLMTRRRQRYRQAERRASTCFDEHSNENPFLPTRKLHLWYFKHLVAFGSSSQLRDADSHDVDARTLSKAAVPLRAHAHKLVHAQRSNFEKSCAYVSSACHRLPRGTFVSLRARTGGAEKSNNNNKKKSPTCSDEQPRQRLACSPGKQIVAGEERQRENWRRRKDTREPNEKDEKSRESLNGRAQ